MIKQRKGYIKEGTLYFIIAIPFLVYIFMFSYVTLFGWSYAFVNFRPALGANPFVHEFVGLHFFRQLWNDRSEIWRVVQNTLAMSFLGLAVSPFTVGLAILMMELRGRMLKRFVQTVTTFPNFISWVIVYGIAFTFFSNRGVLADFMVFLGFERQTIKDVKTRNQMVKNEKVGSKTQGFENGYNA